MRSKIDIWPPDYILRPSARARRLSLRVSDERGLELILPEKTPRPDVVAVLERHRAWITRQLSRRAMRLEKRAALHGESPLAPPPGFWLHGGELRIDLDIGRRAGGAAMQELFRATEPLGTAIWPLADGPDDRLLDRIRMYVKSYARVYLAARARALADSSALRFKSLAFGMQKSRWGSFSAAGVMRLNHKLVFLPAALSDCVILHELCHSAHHNHSPAFWALMREKDPEIIKKNSDLQNAFFWIPAWFY